MFKGSMFALLVNAIRNIWPFTLFARGGQSPTSNNKMEHSQHGSTPERDGRLNIKRIESFHLATAQQLKCPLFSILPGEVRGRVYEYALSCTDDATQIYDDDTSYKRPNYLAVQKADTNLLRTCQQIYKEAWFLPWSSVTHAFWLAWPGRRPDRVMSPEEFQIVLDAIYCLHGNIELNHIQVFSQLCNLESGDDLDPILELENFSPRCMTITIRHHDWWNWEHDDNLYIGAEWVNRCRFPDSLVELRLELESLQRKKDQINSIADSMISSWHFQTVNGTQLHAKAEDVLVSSWAGSSTWEDERWIRDETKPGLLEYHIATVVFRPTKDVEERECGEIGVSTKFQPIESSTPSLKKYHMEAAGVLPGSTADEALRYVQDWRATRNNSSDEEDNEESDHSDEDSSDEDSENGSDHDAEAFSEEHSNSNSDHDEEASHANEDDE